MRVFCVASSSIPLPRCSTRPSSQILLHCYLNAFNVTTEDVCRVALFTSSSLYFPPHAAVRKMSPPHVLGGEEVVGGRAFLKDVCICFKVSL